MLVVSKLHYYRTNLLYKKRKRNEDIIFLLFNIIPIRACSSLVRHGLTCIMTWKRQDTLLLMMTVWKNERERHHRLTPPLAIIAHFFLLSRIERKRKKRLTMFLIRLLTYMPKQSVRHWQYFKRFHRRSSMDILFFFLVFNYTTRRKKTIEDYQYTHTHT